MLCKAQEGGGLGFMGIGPVLGSALRGSHSSKSRPPCALPDTKLTSVCMNLVL